jgi:hypothetical protein
MEEETYKVGDFVCRTTVYTEYFLKDKKIKKEVFNRMVGTVVEKNSFVLTVKLLNDRIVFGSNGTFMLLNKKMAERLEFDE